MTFKLDSCIGPISAFLILAISGCAATPSAKVDFDADVNFANYQSFAWISKNPMKVSKVIEEPRESLEPGVMAAVRTHLESNGYSFVTDPTAADFLLSFTVGSRESINRDSYPSMSTDRGGRGGWVTDYYGGGETAAYAHGLLAIDFFDAKQQRPVWHGRYGKNLRESDREEMPRVIDEAVTSILADFPSKQR
jgi:hypothetical protein